KLAAMRLYGTQIHEHPHTRSEQTLRSLAVLRGMQTGVALAEGFYAMRRLAEGGADRLRRAARCAPGPAPSTATLRRGRQRGRPLSPAEPASSGRVAAPSPAPT